jgi:putative methanogenesis marker protein 8
MKGEHLIQCCGAKVRIRGQSVEVLDDPRIRHCPLHESLYGFKVMNKEAVKKTVEFKIRNYGFCCQHRVFDDALIVSYGASEIIKTCIEMKLLDCAVTVCEGAGTVITSNPSLAQGIGAHLTGIIKTSPVKQIIRRIRAQGGSVLDPKTAQIDQAKGFQKAVEMGFKKIAVTVAGFQAKQITEIRILERNSNARATIFSICNTCTAEKDLKHVVNADIVTAGASGAVRKQVGPKALMQLGVTIPVFALTDRGKDILLAYLSKLNQKIAVFRAHLPYVVEKKGPTLKPRWERKTKTLRTRQNSSSA